MRTKSSPEIQSLLAGNEQRKKKVEEMPVTEQKKRVDPQKEKKKLCVMKGG